MSRTVHTEALAPPIPSAGSPLAVALEFSFRRPLLAGSAGGQALSRAVVQLNSPRVPILQGLVKGLRAG